MEHFYELRVCSYQTIGLNNGLFCPRQRDIVWENEGGCLKEMQQTESENRGIETELIILLCYILHVQ